MSRFKVKDRVRVIMHSSYNYGKIASVVKTDFANQECCMVVFDDDIQPWLYDDCLLSLVYRENTIIWLEDGF